MDLDLKRLIRTVQRELEDSQREREAAGQEPLFKVEELTIELKFAISEEQTAKGGFSLKVIEFGGSDKIAENEIQTLTLRLSALGADPSGDNERADAADKQQTANTQDVGQREARIEQALGLHPSKK